MIYVTILKIRCSINVEHGLWNAAENVAKRVKTVAAGK